MGAAGSVEGLSDDTKKALAGLPEAVQKELEEAMRKMKPTPAAEEPPIIEHSDEAHFGQVEPLTQQIHADEH